MYKDIIKKAGYKLTKPRRLILKALYKKHPIGAREIHNAINKEVDLASVYRTLSLFCSLNIVQKEVYKNKKLYYLSGKAHHHIICRKCGHIECVPCNHVFSHIKHFSNIRHTVSLSGICNACS